VLPPEGTYFVTADITGLDGRDGIEFCLALPERVGVVAVPTQVFYDTVEAGRHLVRFAFCKRPEVLQEAVTRLRRLAPS
jgi:N-succinyldiaminopimelate aminotransferase